MDGGQVLEELGLVGRHRVRFGGGQLVGVHPRGAPQVVHGDLADLQAQQRPGRPARVRDVGVGGLRQPGQLVHRVALGHEGGADRAVGPAHRRQPPGEPGAAPDTMGHGHRRHVRDLDHGGEVVVLGVSGGPGRRGFPWHQENHVPVRGDGPSGRRPRPALVLVTGPHLVTSTRQSEGY
ncbi:hypothetical protein ACFY15_23025 [Streptomyces sp. NPDC001373]|uniref:hypothetical protein n=1 Tax=Streptomyces sp. NPDC001373 TaxID=3364565 RepID=UPI0036C35739